MKKLLYLCLVITIACSSGDENNQVKDTNICSEYFNLTRYCRDFSKGYPYYTVEYKGFIVGEGVKDSDLKFVGLGKVYLNGKPYSGKSVKSYEQLTYKDGMLIHIRTYDAPIKEKFYDDNCLVKEISRNYSQYYGNFYAGQWLDKVTYYKKLPLEEERKIDSIEYYYSTNKILFTTERK